MKVNTAEASNRRHASRVHKPFQCRLHMSQLDATNGSYYIIAVYPKTHSQIVTDLRIQETRQQQTQAEVAATSIMH